jgi:exopolyphosphatase / guanosine-5'-triphosphate,3'-diphosphate pyrophosphatase
MEMIIEFGSNACKVMQCEDNSIFLDYRIPLRLISHLNEEGKLGEAAVQSILNIILDIRNRFPDMQRIILVGTEALRRARNAEEIEDLILEKTSLELNILSEYEEAKAAFKGISSAIKPKGNVLAFDIGGASTEFIFGLDGKIKNIISLPFGAVSLDTQFRNRDPYTNCAFHSLELFLEKNIKVRSGKDYILIGTGGSISTMAAVAQGMKSFDANALNGSVLSRGEIFRQVLMYRSLSIPQICEIPGMDPARADLMLPASLLVAQLIHKAQTDKLIVSTRGVRHGIICAMREQ